jgi:hypothetical protein
MLIHQEPFSSKTDLDQWERYKAHMRRLEWNGQIVFTDPFVHKNEKLDKYLK